MKNSEKPVKEPLFHITKRTDIPKTRAWGIRIVAILASLIVCGIVIVTITDYNPVEVYIKMFEGSFGSERKF
ncbi:MAG: ABC transporter permease, partial [Clostridia bacterium]|nr:ABC transporter permease [Clostridia bacterium]